MLHGKHFHSGIVLKGAILLGHLRVEMLFINSIHVGPDPLLSNGDPTVIH